MKTVHFASANIGIYNPDVQRDILLCASNYAIKENPDILMLTSPIFDQDIDIDEEYQAMFCSFIRGMDKNGLSIVIVANPGDLLAVKLIGLNSHQLRNTIYFAAPGQYRAFGAQIIVDDNFCVSINEISLIDTKYSLSASMPSARLIEGKRREITPICGAIICAKNNKCDTSVLGKYVRFIEIEYSDCTTEYLRELASNLRDKYRAAITLRENRRENCHDPRHENDTDKIRKWLYEHKVDNSIAKKCTEFHRRIMLGCAEGGPRWKLRRLEWSNIMCYGTDNYIDFEKVGGISGIIGRNRYGKSSIIDIIIFALYDIGLRTHGKKFLKNFGADWYRVFLEFEISGSIYAIERKYEKNKSSVILRENGVEIGKGEKITEINERIQKIIGIDCSQMLQTTIIAQDGGGIHKLTEKRRLDLFRDILRLNPGIIAEEIQKERNKLDNVLKFIEGAGYMTGMENQIAQAKLKAEEVRENIKAYEIYQRLMGDIGAEILEIQLSSIIGEINRLLASVVDFKISAKINKHEGLPINCIDVDEGTLPLELCSGFQKFIIDLCARICFAKLNKSPIGDFIIIDEGFTCFDAENMEIVGCILDWIAGSFRHVIVISHMAELQAKIARPMYIERIDNKSRLQWGDTRANVSEAKSSFEDDIFDRRENGRYLCKICGKTLRLSSLSRHVKSVGHRDAVAKTKQTRT